MLSENTNQTLAEFISDKKRLVDCQEGISVIDSPQNDIFIVRWN